MCLYPPIYFFVTVHLLFPPQCCFHSACYKSFCYLADRVRCGMIPSFILAYVHSTFSGISSNFNSIWACLIRYPWVRPFVISSCSVCRSSSVNVTIYLWFILHHPRILYHIFSSCATSSSCLGRLLGTASIISKFVAPSLIRE